MKRLGFVGLGVMGGPMAGHLLAEGHDLTVWSRTPGRTDALASRGAKVAESLIDMGSRCDVVFLCVTKTEDVQECLDELTQKASAGTQFVDHSTISPQGAIDMHSHLQGQGSRFIDAPITGGSMGAQKGQLTIFCGGILADIEEAKPFMSAYAKRVEHVGGPGAGQMTKMANQIAVGGALLALCESLSFAKKAGLDIGLIRELLSGGAAGSWAFDNYGPKVIASDWSPGFSVANQVKDFGYCLDAALEIDAALPGTTLVNELLQEMLEEGDAGLTTAALYKKMLELGGVSLAFAVEMSGIGKSFGSVLALADVSLRVESGTIHALVGENGAGKTTLMRILYGAIQPDAGSFCLMDAEQAGGFPNSAEAIRAGVGMVSQHYSIIPDLTCLENLMLGAEPGWAVDRAGAKVRATELANQMGFVFDWDASASELSPAGAQKLEILKLLWRESRVMILDEPTAMLSPADSDALFVSLKQLVASGSTVIVVTHRLPEVMMHCSDVSVLRGGRLVDSKPVGQTNSSELAELIVGHAMPPLTVRAVPDNADDLLTVHNLTVRGDRGDDALKEIAFEVRKGEVLGLAGVDGSGQRELFQALAGARKAFFGEVLLGGQPILDRSIFERIDLGVRLIPEDRHEEGVMEEWSLKENAALGLQRFDPFAKGPWVQSVARERAAGSIAERFRTKHGGLDMPMASLSGGNQQRFVAGRALFLTPRLILAFQPARGLDIDATRNVYDGLYAECAKGAGALVVSFDLDELLQFCDRIVVLNLGHMSSPATKDRTEIGRLMVGAA